jgi:hypothetical protein
MLVLHRNAAALRRLLMLDDMSPRVRPPVSCPGVPRRRFRHRCTCCRADGMGATDNQAVAAQERKG